MWAVWAENIFYLGVVVVTRQICTRATRPLKVKVSRSVQSLQKASDLLLARHSIGLSADQAAGVAERLNF